MCDVNPNIHGQLVTQVPIDITIISPRLLCSPSNLDVRLQGHIHNVLVLDLTRLVHMFGEHTLRNDSRLAKTNLLDPFIEPLPLSLHKPSSPCR